MLCILRSFYSVWGISYARKQVMDVNTINTYLSKHVPFSQDNHWLRSITREYLQNITTNTLVLAKTKSNLLTLYIITKKCILIGRGIVDSTSCNKVLHQLGEG